jgi:hypothetical protein
MTCRGFFVCVDLVNAVYYNKEVLQNVKRRKKMLNSSRKALLAIITGILVLVLSGCAAKPAPIPQVPEDFVALLDYKQLPSGQAYGSIFVVPNTYKGSVELSAQGKTEKIRVMPGEIKEFSLALKLNVGDIAIVKAGEKTQQIKIKYSSPQQVALGFVDSPASMFKDTTPFYATKGRGDYISIYHIAKKADASMGYPGPDTYWYALTYKNKITIKDTEGMIIVKNKLLDDRKIYYVTSYFYDMDYNYLGGSTGWEAKYMKD